MKIDTTTYVIVSIEIIYLNKYIQKIDFNSCN